MWLRIFHPVETLFHQEAAHLAASRASKDRTGPPAANHGDVFNCVFSRELIHVLLLGAGDGGDPHRSVPRIGNRHRQVFSSSLCRCIAAFGLTPLGLKSARPDIEILDDRPP
jgi:hypothetical protein